MKQPIGKVIAIITYPQVLFMGYLNNMTNFGDKYFPIYVSIIIA